MKTPQDIAELISEDIKQNNGLIYENLYGFRVVDGNNPIDRFIAAIERNYLDFDMKDQKVQELASKLFKKVPSNDELVGLINSSEQDDELKKHLIGLLGSGLDASFGHTVVYYVNSGSEGWHPDELPVVVTSFDTNYKGTNYSLEVIHLSSKLGRFTDVEYSSYPELSKDIIKGLWEQLREKYPEVKRAEAKAFHEIDSNPDPEKTVFEKNFGGVNYETIE